MTKHDPRLYMDIILESIDRIESYINDRSYDDFLNNGEFADAVNMRLQVVGEKVVKIPDEILEKYTEIPWHKVKALRNVISHDYENLDMEEVWNAATVDLKVLKQVVRRMLDELGG